MNKCSSFQLLKELADACTFIEFYSRRNNAIAERLVRREGRKAARLVKILRARTILK